jgi:uncharacterized protein with von Willebrand factor type A (vWA) domain
MSEERPNVADPGSRWLFASPHDLFIWGRIRANSPQLAELAAEVRDRLPTAEPLMDDLFAALYRLDVRWLPGGATDETVEINRPILDRVLTSPSYHRLHPDIAGNEGDAILVLDAFTRAFAASLDPELVELLDAESAFHGEKKRLEAEAQAISDLMSARARPRRAHSTGSKGPEEMTNPERKARLAELAAEMEDLEHQFHTSFKLRRARAELRQYLDGADVPGELARIRQTLDEFHAALVTWGRESGPELPLALEDRLVLFRHFAADERLRRATESLGRAHYQAVGAHRALTRAAPFQISDLRLGDDLTALVPSEAVLLTDPVGEFEFYRRYADHELLIRHHELRGEPSRGPILVLVDESGSMAGDRERVAKAIALALVGIAGADRRDAALLEFSSHGQLRISHFPAGESDLSAVVECLTHFFGGGTDFDAPIGAALRLTEREPRYATADLVIISDGEAPLHPDTVAALEAAKVSGARLFAICVGVDDATFRDVATRTWPAVDLVGAEHDGSLVGELVAAVH